MNYILKVTIMNNKCKLLAGLLLLGTLLLSGCATNTSTFTIDTSSLSTANKPDAARTVYVKTVVDERYFDPKTKDPSVPSIDGETDSAKDQAIGRKRNTYGKALGKLVLADTQSVRSLTRAAIESALIDNGWKVIKSKKEVTDKTKIIDVKIQKFWSWMNPGFWQITLSANISAKLPKSPYDNKEVTIEGSYSEGFQVGTETNWNTVLQNAYKAFVRDAKAKLEDPDK